MSVCREDFSPEMAAHIEARAAELGVPFSAAVMVVLRQGAAPARVKKRVAKARGPQLAKNLKSYVTPSLMSDRAKKHRASPTPAEKRLWSALRRDSLGVKFRRQHVLGSIIADFYCSELAIVVEVDGGYHHDAEMIDRDARRDLMLSKKGFTVLRFDNSDIHRQLPITLGVIEAAIARLRK